MRINLRNNNTGFTLVEIIATMVLFGVIAATVGMIIVTFLNSYVLVKQSTDVSQKAQLVFRRLQLEFEYISDVYSADSQSVYYRRKSDTMVEVERVAGLDGSEIKLSNTLPITSGNVLIDGVVSFSLSYFNSSGDISGPSNWSASGSWGSSNSMDLAAIRIDLTLAHDAGDISFSTTIYPRYLTGSNTGPDNWNSL